MSKVLRTCIILPSFRKKYRKHASLLMDYFILQGHVGKDRQNFTALSTVPEGIRSKMCQKNLIFVLKIYSHHCLLNCSILFDF